MVEVAGGPDRGRVLRAERACELGKPTVMPAHEDRRSGGPTVQQGPREIRILFISEGVADGELRGDAQGE